MTQPIPSAASDAVPGAHRAVADCRGRFTRRVVAALFAVTASSCALPPGTLPSFAPRPESTAEILSVVHAPLDTRRFDAVAPTTEVLGALQVMRTRHEDTFTDLARVYDLGYAALRAANPEVDPWLPGAGTPVYLPTLQVIPDAPRNGIVVNLPSMRLLAFESGAAGAATQRVFSHPIGIGREGWETPTGAMHVTQKTRDPTWYPPASVRAEHAAAGDPLPAAVPPGPDNPLGRHRLRLSKPNYLIHGTNKPGGVGMRVSHGCIRLYPEDIETLFERVALKTPVYIVDQPVLAGWRDGELYLEVHPPLAEDPRDLAAEAARVIAAALARGGVARAAVDEALVAELVRQRRGIPVPVTRPGMTLAGWLTAAREVQNLAPARLEADGNPRSPDG
ncbi:MAG: L,D-transpeptidase family protein [Gammaproteobacteria bacterium]